MKDKTSLKLYTVEPKYTDIEEKLDREDFEEHCPDSVYMSPILPPVDRIVVIGDLHGDFDLTLTCLELSGVIKKGTPRNCNIPNIEWTGGNTVIVQIGDQIDRCRPVNGEKCYDKKTTPMDEGRDRDIMELFTELNKKAVKCGGKVYSLIGNHELMNIIGNMDYVSYEGLQEFKDYKDPKNPTKTFCSGMEARKHAFRPGNEYGNMMGCDRLSVVIIGDFMFAHAGVVTKFVTDEYAVKSDKDLYALNRDIRRWLLNLINKDNISAIVKSFRYSLFWNRILGSIPPNMSNEHPDCHNNLDKVFEMFNVGNMVIGHTPQFYANNEGINSTCGNTLHRVDTGGSGAFDKFDCKNKKRSIRKAQVLEITNNKCITVLKSE